MQKGLMSDKKEYLREWHQKNKERTRSRRREAMRRWYKRHRERIRKDQNSKRDPRLWALRMKKYRDDNKEKVKGHRLKAAYGINLGQFKNMLAAQDGKCAICLYSFTKTPHVDHDHKTGKIRGLLCSQCNTGIGYFKEDIMILRSAENYLEKWRLDT